MRSARIEAAIRSPITVTGIAVAARGTDGISAASATRQPGRPRTSPRSSQTASGSLAGPIFAVPTGCQ